MKEEWKSLKLDRSESKSKAIYIQLADRIIELIKQERLVADDVMPSTRSLASVLDLNRNTIVRALDILISEGWLISQERKKIYVSNKLSITHTSRKKETKRVDTEKIKSNLIFFDDGLADAACSPIEELARAYRRIFTRKARWRIMDRASELGDEGLRETICRMLNETRNMQTSLPELCITRGSQMALFLTAHCLLQKEDVVLIENPGFKPAWNTFEHAGARIIPIPVDEDGVNIGVIENVLKTKKVKAIYLTPHHQYPTTVTLSLSRRLRLIELSNQYNFTIIEDDYNSEFHFAPRPVMPISAHDEMNNYVYIGTLSKLIAPAVRVGYVASSPSFITKMGDLRKIIDKQGDSIMEQSILELFISGDIRRHRKRMLNHYEKKRNTFAQLIDTYLKDRVIYKIPEGGLAFWLQPAKETDLFQVQQKAYLENVSFYTPNRFSYAKNINGLRLGYGALEEANLERGLRVLSKYLLP